MMIRNPIVGNSLKTANRLSTSIIMNTKLYVGNLTFDATENELKELFAQHGPVTEVNLVQDRVTGKARGFAFVTMETKEAADAAIQALNGKDWQGRALTVNEARPREARTGGGGGGGYRGGGGGGGGGYGGGRRPNRY
jgi:cold-inducible RNA-binding protein